MLVRFFVENFKSFKGRNEFNMLAGTYKRHSEHIVNTSHGVSVLKNAAIYGTNASGKTNFIQAIEALTELVINGTKDKKDAFPFRPFKLEKSYLNKPTKFEIDFINKEYYSYSIVYNENTILEEWLYRFEGDDAKIVFERETNEETKKTKLKFDNAFFSTEEERIRLKIYESDLRHNQPFLTEGYNKNLKYCNDAYEWFDNKVNFNFLNSKFFRGLAFRLSHDEEFKNKYLDILLSSEIGIDKIDVQEIPFELFFGKDQESFKKFLEKKVSNNKGVDFGTDFNVYSAYLNTNGEPVVGKLVLFHKDLDGDLVEFEIDEESKGVQKLLDLIPAIIYASEENEVIFADEIESSIHPVLIKSLLKLLISKNAKSNGQIIFTTHESQLLDLDLLRQDEFWLFEKAKDKSTNIYSLSDFKVRFDLDIKKGYLDGKFGAIPFLNSSKFE